MHSRQLRDRPQSIEAYPNSLYFAWYNTNTHGRTDGRPKTNMLVQRLHTISREREMEKRVNFCQISAMECFACHDAIEACRGAAEWAVGEWMVSSGVCASVRKSVSVGGPVRSERHLENSAVVRNAWSLRLPSNQANKHIAHIQAWEESTNGEHLHIHSWLRNLSLA